MGYDAREMAKWGVGDWLSNKGEAPLVDMVYNASADMVDYNLAIMFQSQQCSSNYLRIQVLPASVLSIHYLHRVGPFKGDHLLTLPVSYLSSCVTTAFIHEVWCQRVRTQIFGELCRPTTWTDLLHPWMTHQSQISGSWCRQQSTYLMSQCRSAISKLESSLPFTTMGLTVKLSTGIFSSC